MNFGRRRIHVLALLPLLGASLMMLHAQPQSIGTPLSPIERSGFSRLTSYDSLKSFVAEIARRPGISVSTIATTSHGRSVFLVRYSAEMPSPGTPTLRALLFAQQHGDEPSGKEALTVLLTQLARGELRKSLEGVELYIVPQMNPDGAELRQRRTETGIDLNRSHVLLHSPETAGLQEAFFAIHPHVTLDIVKRVDVQLGMLTNPNSSDRLIAFQHSAVFPFITGRMAAAGYHFHEYLVGTPSDRLRHSTTEINDGRQSFGILSTLSFIQEGRQGLTLEVNLERRVRSQLVSIMALLEFCQAHRQQIISLVSQEQSALNESAGRPFSLRMEHLSGERQMTIPVSTFPGGIDSLWRVSPYHSVVHILDKTTVPSGYIVPAGCSTIIELLKKHHVEFTVLTTPRVEKVGRYAIDSVGFDVLEEDSLPRPFVHLEESTVTLKPGDVLVPTSQWHSMFLATLLEPESMWGLTKYQEFDWTLKKKWFPVMRANSSPLPPSLNGREGGG